MCGFVGRRCYIIVILWEDFNGGVVGVSSRIVYECKPVTIEMCKGERMPGHGNTVNDLCHNADTYALLFVRVSIRLIRVPRLLNVIL